MNTISVFLADFEPGDGLRGVRPALREWLIILGAIGAVTLLLVLWAMFVRKKRRRRHSHYHEHHHAPKPTEVPLSQQGEDVPAPPEKHRRRRRSHHRHRPRNPTLAETGGLPPIRPEGPPEAKP
jgi:hypothetical protein